MTSIPNALTLSPSPSKTDLTVGSAIPAPLNHRLVCRPPEQPTASIDRAIHATIARTTGGLSPAALAMAYCDWAAHLNLSPGKRMQLSGKAVRQWTRLARYAFQRATLRHKLIDPCINPLPQDKRFADERWKRWPYNMIYQSFYCNSSGGTVP